MDRDGIDQDSWERLQEWDGSPNNFLPDEYVQSLYDQVPHYHACAFGPIPFGSTEPIHLIVDNILCEDAEEARERLVSFIEHMCRVWRVEYDEDDWDIHHVVLICGN